jgi:hypothetical protein
MVICLSLCVQISVLPAKQPLLPAPPAEAQGDHAQWPAEQGWGGPVSLLSSAAGADGHAESHSEPGIFCLSIGVNY